MGLTLRSVVVSDDDVAPSFSSAVHDAGGEPVLELHGVADANTAGLLVEAVGAFRARYRLTGRVLDVAELRFVDSTAWRALLESWRGVDEVEVRNARPMFRRVHALAGHGPLRLTSGGPQPRRMRTANAGSSLEADS